jgi:hypothetical protein
MAHLPANLIFYCVFSGKYNAFAFERYLKAVLAEH